MTQKLSSGEEMHALAARLFPLCRSITGDGVRETLKILQEHIPLTLHEVPSGTQVFDWVVPREWNIRDAYVEDETGARIIDFKKNNLHIVGYSTPIDTTISLKELQEHLYSLPEQPEAIPYVTSYYQERWGFCLTHEARERLKEGTYHVVIDSELKDGSLTYGELVIPGRRKEEVFLSTYICHPSMGNNELSGPVVAASVAQWLMQEPREYTYRLVFIPETIGSLTYLSEHSEYLKAHVIAGFNLTCVGDDRAYSFLPSRLGDTRADRVARRVLRVLHPEFIQYSYLERGSDERQYCSPGVDLPVVSIMRSRYGTYPEYHTSLDDLSFITPSGLKGGVDVLVACIEMLEKNRMYKAAQCGEPQLGRRGLYPTLSQKGSVQHSAQRLLDILAYADGTRDADDIADKLGASVEEIVPSIETLLKAELLIEC